MRYLLLLFVLVNQGFSQDSPRKTTNLNGEWRFHRDGSKETKTVTLPTHWETHEGLKFDGVGWYEKTIELPELPAGRRLLLHFDGVATHATVYWNDVKLGVHLGAWTPFRFDVTEAVKKSQTPPSGGRQPPVNDASAGKAPRGADTPRSDSMTKHTIKVRVDEKVGHNTQGFLPIFAPHFGGIWQGVRLIEVPETYLDDLRLTVKYVRESNEFIITLPIAGSARQIKTLSASCSAIALHSVTSEKKNSDMNEKELLEHYQREKEEPRRKLENMTDKERWDDLKRMRAEVQSQLQSSQVTLSELKSNTTLVDSNGCVNVKARPSNSVVNWSPMLPFRYAIEIKAGEDTISAVVAHRKIETKGDQFLLNGQPLSIRGVLNWGYYPPSLAPTPTEEQWRADLKLIKSWGFNLMKCCLWVPPKRLLEIADEEGVLLWIEYPTWHPKLTPQYQAELMQEYKEFHELDRNHPSVILRSLTCETGPGADIKVIQALYDQCKKMCGGLVVDDSSWIEWNRVFDFYDDHPYGNNHTWVATLDRLKKYIATSKYGVKPLCLGEAIAADTWVPTKPMLEAIAKAKADPKQAWSFDERGYPFWVPGFFDANRKWLERMGRVCGGPVDEDLLHKDSLEYARKMRKYQMTTFEKEVPHGGYVVSVMRDFPLAGMGLVDYLGKPKWSEDLWSWHLPGAKPVAEKVFASMLFKSGSDIDVRTIRQVSKLDDATLDYLQQGGKVLLEANGRSGSFPTRSQWFLKGAPFINRHHPIIQGQDVPFFFTQHQHFELASDVIPDVNYLEEIDPIVMLWDNHDIKEVKTHGLLFETRVGQGRLLVSSFNLQQQPNLAKKWLNNRLLKHLDSGPPPRNALKPETIARMRAKLNEKKLELVTKSWQFMPDGKNEGLKLRWEKPGFDDKAWKPIKIGQHWEGQGYPTLDGWAWYRLSVEVPKDWAGVPIYLNSEGVDDAYEIYVNGIKIGEGGDIPNKKTAFEERKAHTIPANVLKPGEKNVIAVRVYDWYGAGGIHRPMTLSNVPIGGIDILK